jgi:hypothetical protein
MKLKKGLIAGSREYERRCADAVARRNALAQVRRP